MTKLEEAIVEVNEGTSPLPHQKGNEMYILHRIK